jgi:hypothetical protein
MTLGIGIHNGVDAEPYHRDVLTAEPSLSSSIIKVLLNQSPEHARDRHPRQTASPSYKWPETDAMKTGNVAHSILLGAGAKFKTFYPSDYLTAKGDPCETLGCADAKAAIAAWRAEGGLDIGEKTLADATTASARMLAAIQEDYPAWDTGQSEVTLIFEYLLNDHSKIYCKARPDRLVMECRCVESDETHVHLFDPKFSGRLMSDAWIDTTAERDGWGIQDSLYSLGIEKLTGSAPLFSFVLGELFPPYTTRFVTLPDGWKRDARLDVDRAANVWGACIKSGVWPNRTPRHYVPTRPAWGGGGMDVIETEESE